MTPFLIAFQKNCATQVSLYISQRREWIFPHQDDLEHSDKKSLAVEAYQRDRVAHYFCRWSRRKESNKRHGGPMHRGALRKAIRPDINALGSRGGSDMFVITFFLPLSPARVRERSRWYGERAESTPEGMG